LDDYTNEAEQFFCDFADRHSLTISKVEQENVELLMVVVVQDRLSFELVLGLQNGDEINIGIGKFWSHFFPFTAELESVSKLLDGLVTGKTRLVTHRQFSRVAFRDMEILSEGIWTRGYRHICGVKIPFVSTQVSYMYNTNSNAA
jgi:hypothetical protein